jgi:sortase A
MSVTEHRPDDDSTPAEAESLEPPAATEDATPEPEGGEASSAVEASSPADEAADVEASAEEPIGQETEKQDPTQQVDESDDDYDASIEAAVEAIAFHPVFEVIEEGESATEADSGQQAKKTKKKISIGAALRTFFLSRGFSRGLGVVGESLITLGVIVMLFLGWQLWVNDVIIFNESTAVAEKNVAKWTTSKTPVPTSTQSVTDYGPAPVMARADLDTVFGNIYIPRFGNDYIKVAAEGVDAEGSLNRGYFGHYPDSQLPGESGNVAFAVHRAGHGSPFREAPKLRTGDIIVLQTSDGYYKYQVRNTEYVMPSQVAVVGVVPGGGAAVPGQSLLTITTCNPELGNNERLITYSVMIGWQPANAGPPEEIASMVKA